MYQQRATRRREHQRIILAAVFAVGAALASAPNAQAQFAGRWTGSGLTVDFIQNGGGLIGKDLRGNIIIRGTVHGNRLNARVITQGPRTARGRCPNYRVHWSPLNLRLSPNRRRLAGIWTRYRLRWTWTGPIVCGPSGTVAQRVAFRRVGNAPQQRGHTGCGGRRPSVEVCSRLIRSGTYGRSDLANFYFQRGLAHSDRKQYRQAIRDYGQAIRLDPRHYKAYSDRGNVWHRMGQSRKAIGDYNRALRINPRDHLSYANRAAAWEKLGNRRMAIRDYQATLRLRPNDRIAKAGLRRLGGGNGGGGGCADRRPSVADCTRIIRSGQYNGVDLAVFYLRRCFARYRLRRYGAAIADCRRAVQLDRKQHNAYWWLSRAYSMRNLHRAQIAALNAYITLQRARPAPQSRQRLAAAYNNRAWAYYKIRQPQRGLLDVNQALRINGRLATAYDTRGHIHAALRRRNAAIADFKRAISLSRKNSPAYKSSAAGLRKLGLAAPKAGGGGRVNMAGCKAGNRQAALDACSRLVRKAGLTAATLHHVHIARGRTYMNLSLLASTPGYLKPRYRQRAIKDFSRAIQLNRSRAGGYRWRGVSYTIIHSLDKSPGALRNALRDINMALRIHPRSDHSLAARCDVHNELGNRPAAVRDCRGALRINPNNTLARSILKRIGVRR